MTQAKRAAPASRPAADTTKQATGRNQKAWFALLDKWGAASRTHKETAAWLRNEHGVASWWSQRITVDYEHARGLRPVGGDRDGTFAVNATRTVAAPVERVFEAFVNARVRGRWLPGVPMRQRTSQPNRTARFDWEDGSTRLIVGFVGTGRDRSQVAISHERLPDARTAEKTKAFWRERLAALKALLES